MAEPRDNAESVQFFELLFRPKRTANRDCDEDQLTAALAACCRLVPALGVHLADLLFDTRIDPPAPGDVEIQFAESGQDVGKDEAVRYDLLLGTSPSLPRLGLVIENKLESGFGSRIVVREGAETVRSQLEQYLRLTGRWVVPPRVGAIVKYRQDRPRNEDFAAWGDRWGGCVTWNDVDEALRAFPADQHGELALSVVHELRDILIVKRAVMAPVPPTIAHDPSGWEHLDALLTTALAHVAPGWKRERFTKLGSGFWYRVRAGVGRRAGLSYRPGYGTYVILEREHVASIPEAELSAADLAPDDHPTWECWLRSREPLPLDFASHRTWQSQFAHAKDVLSEALNRVPPVM